jgi:hypothetical protein
LNKKTGKTKNHHKDTIFRNYFKIPGHFIDLLNHCRGQTYDLAKEELTPFDLESSVAIRIRRNDVSFITKDNRLIIFIEHQSTINPNMALRLFLYYIELIQLWITKNGVNLYGEAKVQNLPKPEFYVVYIGKAPLKDLYSTFQLEHTDVRIETAVKITDIHFEQLRDQTPGNALAGYSFFYKVYDENLRAGFGVEESFNKARAACMEQRYMEDFIERDEFVMSYKNFLDYDTQLIEEGKIEGKIEGMIEGEIKGKIEGMINAAINMVKKMQFSVTQAMQITELSEQERPRVIAELEKENISYAL